MEIILTNGERIDQINIIFISLTFNVYNMKRIIFVIILLISLINLRGSPQKPDLLIIGKDTIALYALPMQDLDDMLRAHTFHTLIEKEQDKGISFNLWRGYQGVWKLENDSIFLVDINSVSDAKNIMETVFEDDYRNNKVFADWASFSVIIPKGKHLRWDGIFSSTFEKEEHINVLNGKVIGRSKVNNYIKVKGGISRKQDKKKIAKLFFDRIKKLDWKYLDECGCDGDYSITIDSLGMISKVEKRNYSGEMDEEDFECAKIIKKAINKMRFDIIRWQGRPYEETLLLDLFYDTEKGVLENFSD